MAPLIPSSTVNHSFATNVNENSEMTEAPIIPIINEPPTLAEIQNNFSVGPSANMPVNVEDELLSVESPSVNDHDLISDVSSNASGRSRKLKDREKTHEVRKKGACLGCRIQKTPCDKEDQCANCRDFCAENNCPFVPCMRRKLSETHGGVSKRWQSKEMIAWYESLTRGRTRPGGSNHEVEIRRSPNPSSEPLEVTCREVMSGSSDRAGHSPIYLALGIIPTDETLRTWIEKDMLLENRTSFAGRIEQCLASYKTAFQTTYVSNGELSPSAQKEAAQLYRLMEGALKMTCMLKIWAYDVRNMFFTSGTPFSQQQQLLPVQLHLHLRAGAIISSAEGELLKELDAFLQPPSTLKQETSDTRSAFTVALWLSMWQVILIYQEVLNQMSSIDVMIESAERRNFIRMTEELFEGVVVMYSNRFRTSTIVKRILDAMDNLEVSGSNDAALSHLKAAWIARNDFFNALETNPHPNRQENILKAYVIAREKEVFGRRSAIDPIQKQKYGPRV
ncbi:hypothetical protein B0T20DRAFT_49605 [Sordaria brevicollis]|uniref:Zn(2)-C6 fungal-type domain-containing protein n=1 Tax=Sordaria brevicollis TaxID=83679 RepID=A0AAE0U9I8_SORBR|nr:hypothetical protein B0T20DRAFT_49605 [Sordaria brevicollis]